MRKETTARLLLSLFTAFIMVAGALGAALPSLISQMDAEESEMPSVVLNEAGSEQDLPNSETGDAPVSAENTDSIAGPTQREENQQQVDPDQEGEFIDDPLESIMDNDIDHGTRNPDTVDAGGPYGSGMPFDPLYEGDPITFDASIEPEDEQENYKFRWDWNNDGVFDGPGDASTDYFGEDGESSFTKTVYDDYKGTALVQAWDGSWDWITDEGIIMGEGDYDSHWWWYPVTDYMTWGWTFEVTEDGQIDQLGAFVSDIGYPYLYYNIRIWDDTPAIIGYVNNPTMPSSDSWEWYNLATPVDVYTGTTYTISAYVYSYYGEMPMMDDPGPTSDGMVIPIEMMYENGDNFPSIPSAGAPFPMIDFHYSMTYGYPIVIEDTAKVLVWNREPTVYAPTVSPTYTNEGEEGAYFSAQMVDLGLDDDWWFQWDWGDGSESEWMPVPKWSGGGKVLFLTTWEDSVATTMADLQDELGPWIVQMDSISFLYGVPDLSQLLPYDVVVCGTNYRLTDPVAWLAIADGVGDLLADYADQGGNVVQCWSSFHTDPRIQGRWTGDLYNAIERGSLASGTENLGMVYDPTHPIMDGVTSLTSYYKHNSYAATLYANQLADYDSGKVLAAYTDKTHPNAPDSRIVGLSMFPASVSGDAFKLLANAVKWASQAGDLDPLSQPLTLPPVSHIYVDDHPEHITPSDQIIPRVRVKDDDHCHDVILGDPVIFYEDFDGSWGTYGDNPPPGWTIEDQAPDPPAYWDSNDWYRYYYSTLDGTSSPYNARVYYTPAENQDEELISPVIDVTGYSTVNINWNHRFYGSSTAGHAGEVDYRLDGGAWVNGYVAVSSYSNEFDQGFDVTTGGASTIQYRFHYWDWDSNYKYWTVGDVEVKSGSDVLYTENWESSWGTYGDNPPTGWTILDHGTAAKPWDYNDWHRYSYSTSYLGGTGTYAARVYYSPYEQCNEWLISPEMDLTAGGFNDIILQFNTWYDVYSTSTHEAFVLYSLNGGPWQTIVVYSGTTDIGGVMTYDLSSLTGNKVRIAFHWQCYTDYYPENRYRWYIDNFDFQAIPEIKHVYGMTDWLEGPPVTVVNVAPSIFIPDTVPKVVTENSGEILIEGVELTDPAMYSGTEDFFYRMDYQDGSAVGPWNKIASGAGIMYEDYEASPGTWPWSPWVQVGAGATTTITTAAAHDGLQGASLYDTGSNGYYYRTDISIGNAGDILSMWVRPNGDWQRVYLGFAADSVGCYSFTIGPNANEIEIESNYPYGTFTNIVAQPFTFTNLHWYRAELEFVSTTEVIGRLYDDDGTTLLAEISLSYSFGLPGGIANRGFDFDMDTIDNGAKLIDPEIPAFTVEYMDNGIYYTDVQAIDDDMYWDTSGSTPVFVGPNNDPNNPGADPNDWIKHNYIPIEVLNIDPVILPRVKAFAQLDLSLRISGTKDCDATMTLYENGDDIGTASVTRDPGSPDIGIMPSVNLMMTKDYEYELVVVVTGGSGGNPTWIFDMVFPDGKFKEFKHTFNDEHGWTWVISNSELKGALLGHDIIFEAEAEDIGSDDLAFVWNFGDSTPHGIHLYANVDQTTAVDAVSDEATVLFDQLPIRDAYFTKAANDVRTPLGTSMSATDTISHVFDENQPYYYYVTLTVMDDDVYDGYPSPFLNGGGYDMEFVEIDFR